MSSDCMLVYVFTDIQQNCVESGVFSLQPRANTALCRSDMRRVADSAAKRSCVQQLRCIASWRSITFEERVETVVLHGL